MRPPSSSKPRSPTTDAIQLQGPAHAAQALLPRTTPSPRLASPGRGLLRRPGADGASAPPRRASGAEVFQADQQPATSSAARSGLVGGSSGVASMP